MRLNPNNPNNLSRCDDLFILAWAFLSLVPFRWGQTTEQGAPSDSLGSLQNYDGDGKENVKKNNRFNEQINNSARASRFFAHLSLYDNDVKSPHF